MSEKIKNHGLNLLIKIIVTLGAVVLIYFTLTSFLFTQSTKLEKKESNYGNETSQTPAESASASVSKEDLSAGFITTSSNDISIPESLSLSQYEKLIASSTMSKAKICKYLTMNEYDCGLAEVGPGFILRGGQAGLEVYLPYLQGVLDDELISQGQSLVRVDIDSIIDKSNKNILDIESPFEKNSFFNKLKFEKIFNEQFDKYYKTERALHLKGNQLSIVDDIKKITGSLIFYLPIAVNKYTLSIDQIVTKSNVKVGNATVAVMEIKDGAVYLRIKSTSKSVIYVKCFNQNGKVLATSMITMADLEESTSNGFNKQSIINFNPRDSIDHLEIYAPSEVITEKYHFAI